LAALVSMRSVGRLSPACVSLCFYSNLAATETSIFRLLRISRPPKRQACCGRYRLFVSVAVTRRPNAEVLDRTLCDETASYGSWQGTARKQFGWADMTNQDITTQRHASLREFIDLEVAGIVASASQQGFTSHETLDVLIETVRHRLSGIDGGNENADSLPAGPHSASGLVDKSKTPGTGALPEAGQLEIDPGVG